MIDPKLLSAIHGGKLILLTDSSDRENEGDLVCAAEKVTPKTIAFMAKFGRGLICVSLTAERAKELNLNSMSRENTAPMQCNFTVSVDLKKGVTTGISAFDRAKTIKALVSKSTVPDDFARPGHVFPLIAREGGVLVRTGHTEGSIDLMNLAKMKPVAVICEVMGDDGKMLRGIKMKKFAAEHKIPIVTIQSVIEHRRKNEKLISKVVESVLPTEFGEFKIVGYRSKIDDKEHVALVMGEIAKHKSVLVRVHSECLTGDVFNSLRCDCGPQLRESLRQISAEGCGIVLYMRQEGRGIGLLNKLKAYNLQDRGYDTVTANEKLGFKADLREYGIGAQILVDLGVSKMRLMTNNPQKIIGLSGYGLTVVKRIPIEVPSRSKKNDRYMRAKKNKMGHLLSDV